MQKSVDEIVKDADWKELTPRLLYFGEMLIRKCPWRGIPVTARAGSKLCVDGCGADDFLQEALDRLLTRRRAYDHSLSLEQNVRRAIKSIIWSANKSSRRSPLTEIGRTEREEVEPIEQLPDPASSGDAAIIAEERTSEQRHFLAEFEKSLACEPELLRLVSAYKEGHFKPQGIEKLTGIPASRISELKRKLRSRMNRFEAGLRQHQSG
jgi:DNA-directed RNA polymerase specialized sigma24 family protein